MTATSGSTDARPLSTGINRTSGRIVVGFDGSEPGWRALRWAANEARLRQALLEVVLAFDVSSPAISFGLASVASPRTDDAIELRAQTAVSDAVREVQEGELVVHPLALAGRPGAVLVGMSRGADLLVLGSTGHSALRDLVVGSTVEFCLHHVACPVVVIPNPSKDRQGKDEGPHS